MEIVKQVIRRESVKSEGVCAIHTGSIGLKSVFFLDFLGPISELQSAQEGPAASGRLEGNCTKCSSALHGLPELPGRQNWIC